MQTRVDIRAKRALYHFDSLYELGQYVTDAPRRWRSNSSHDNPPETSWDLQAGYSGAIELARNGWIEGAQRVQEALKAFQAKTPEPDTRTDVYGFRPHVPRFCAGAPDSMIRHATVAETGAGRVLTLVVPVAMPSRVNATHAANFGIAVAQYVNQMETNGTRVELIASVSNAWEIDHSRDTLDGTAVGKAGAWRTVHTWTIKGADQPLDLAVIAFAIGHPAMHRRLGFALLERCDAPESPFYAYPVHTVASDLINAPPGIVILNGMREADRHAKTPEKALEYVTKQIDAALQAQEL